MIFPTESMDVPMGFFAGLGLRDRADAADPGGSDGTSARVGVGGVAWLLEVVPSSWVTSRDAAVAVEEYFLVKKERAREREREREGEREGGRCFIFFHVRGVGNMMNTTRILWIWPGVIATSL